MNMLDILRRACGAGAQFTGIQALFQRPGGKLVSGPESSMLSPCEGVVQEIGLVNTQQPIAGKPILAKPRLLDLKALLGNTEAAGLAEDGEYITIYLAPWHLHYVLFPFSGTCTVCRYLPGRCRPLFLCQGSEVKNERLVTCIDTEQGFPAAVIMIGSFLVSSLTAVCSAGENYRLGDHLGTFGLGSTVVVVTPPGRVGFKVQPGDKLTPGELIAVFRETIDER